MGNFCNNGLKIVKLIVKSHMSHGTMKYKMKAHVCYFALMVELLHYLYSVHADLYTSENIVNGNRH
jgi:hypothetical protein